MPWRNTTHDWASIVDAEHLAKIRQHPTVFAPGGSLHLILEVMAYAADGAESTSSGCCVVTLHGDNSVSVADNGRGTDTRYDDCAQPIRKPVMATRDLRFFDFPDAQTLPDGYPRRGMSTVARPQRMADAHQPTQQRGVDPALGTRPTGHRPDSDRGRRHEWHHRAVPTQ